MIKIILNRFLIIKSPHSLTRQKKLKKEKNNHHDYKMITK